MIINNQNRVHYLPPLRYAMTATMLKVFNSIEVFREVIYFLKSHRSRVSFEGGKCLLYCYKTKATIKLISSQNLDARNQYSGRTGAKLFVNLNELFQDNHPISEVVTKISTYGILLSNLLFHLVV